MAVTSRRGRGLLRAVKAILLLLTLQGILAVGLWRLTEDWLLPEPGAPRLQAAAAERLAELSAAAAVRAVLTPDAATLAALVRRAAAWPDIVYVGVEDAEGRVLAHTDSTRIGQVWNEAMSTKIRVAVGAAHRELTVPIADPARKDGPALGRIRLSYVALDAGPMSVGSRSSMLVLVLAVAAILPLGGLIAYRVAPRAARASKPHNHTLETLVQAAWPDRERLRTEIEVARITLDHRDSEIARLRQAIESGAPPTPPALSSPRAIMAIAQAVRSSLTSILGFSKLLLREADGPLTESQTADVMNIQRAGLDLLRFVTGFSDLMRAEAGQVRPQLEPVDLPALLHELAREYGSAHSLDIHVDAPGDLPLVRIDRAHAAQILHALITQAITLSGHGEVVLRPWISAAMVHLAVAHPGRAIPVETVATIFDPFVTKETSSARVGLALARTLARLNGGDIVVAQEPGQGVVFTVAMPQAVPAEVA
jgi:signal transduction histidine kinase